ncbi:MAG TPA: ATP-binding protein [Myxococcaceae bacterium]|jgi:signal transduction histidine kinase|nr:ATP-binding protein [Myxococcaceae bacterium]
MVDPVITSVTGGTGRLRPPTSPEAQPAMRRARLILAMVCALAAVLAVAVWDERREARAALDDFAQEQTAVARSAAAALVARVQGRACAERESPCLASALAAIDESAKQPGTVVVLVRPPGEKRLLDTHARPAGAPALEAALDGGRSWVSLGREESAGLGLPRRTSLAGLARMPDAAGRTWSVAVVATAQRVRDRESRALWRLVLGMALASLLVGTFGGMALREQRRELELQRTVAVAEAVHARDRRLVEADKLATLGALATGIAHEVSTPLGVIMGRAEQLLPRTEPGSRSHGAVSAILEQAERISRIIRGFLTLARGGAASLTQVDPAALARSALELVEHRFAQADVALVFHRPEPGLPPVACDPALFEQVLVNLLLNACDACTAGGKVELRVEQRHDRVAFLVDDDGMGISPEQVKRCLEPLFTTKAPGKGTGLGLTIASEIVKHHHGTISFQPRAEAGLGPKGTRVRVEIAAVSGERRDATG